MCLILCAVSLDGAPLSRTISARFDRSGGTIGRSDQNTMALPDPNRYISRQHARIAADDAGFTIQNVSKDNAIVVRQLTIEPGESAPLRQHDTVCIGGYLLKVLQARWEDEPGHDAESTAHRPQPRDSGRGAASGLGLSQPSHDGGLRPLSPGNPFASLLAPLESELLPEGLNLPPPEDGMAQLPPNMDLLGQPRVPKPKAGANPFEDMIPESDSLSIDALIGSVGDVAQPRAEAPNRAEDRVPELRAAFNPPRPLPPQDLQAPAPADVVDIPIGSAVKPVPAAGEQELWAAFCRGAGISLDLQGAASVDVMTQAGALLRLGVEGTLQLMSLRASTRNELHASVTLIRARENNPLKFSPDVNTALERLLLPPSRGFLPGEAAMAEAMSELVGHTIGTMAGMRAALEGVLEHFTPEELEGKLDGAGVLERVMPMTRKARLWELYLQHYGKIRTAAQDDFHALFGKAFLAAYEQQVERLRREWKTRTG